MKHILLSKKTKVLYNVTLPPFDGTSRVARSRENSTPEGEVVESVSRSISRPSLMASSGSMYWKHVMSSSTGLDELLPTPS